MHTQRVESRGIYGADIRRCIVCRSVLSMALVSQIDCIHLPCDLPSRTEKTTKPHSLVLPGSRISHRLPIACQPSRASPRWLCSSSIPGPGPVDDSDGDELDIEQALQLDGQIPSTSDALLKQVSSRAYDMRRRLEQSIDSSSYDGQFSLTDLKCQECVHFTCD
ncbi:hypothetical protein KP509_21G011200 [Ceratopteris richardii]|uniref:Uncharacterized protein n=1 Tax=Ceratopteris richardii TaxID=49495 RepID=A0A8T2S8S0_CERRI|nr:hypothetical protein KP509_21G011200 [Ceratopteris richardii]